MTLHDVRDAARQLCAEGMPVTTRHVRALIGGSQRDVVPLLRRVKEEIKRAQFEELKARVRLHMKAKFAALSK